MLAVESEPSRRDRKKERTRREIYEAAMRLFAESGFGPVTIADICREADVGRGTFFFHFPSKASLLHEFNRRVAEEFRSSLPSRRGSASDELTALVERMSVEAAPVSVTTLFANLLVCGAPAFATGAWFSSRLIVTVSGVLASAWLSVTTSRKMIACGAPVITGAVNVGFCTVALESVACSGSSAGTGSPSASICVQAYVIGSLSGSL